MIKCKKTKGCSPVPHVEVNKYSPHKRNGWSVTLYVLLALLFPAFASAQITGTVYRDFNADGTQDALEPGVSGITVTAYDATNSSVSTTTTAADGTYTLTPGAGSFRIEVTGLPSYLQPGALGSDSETTVTFASDGDTGVDVSLNYPTDYSQSNPYIATSCFTVGDQYGGGTAANKDAIVSVLYNASGANPIPENSDATNNEVGSVWGLAWHRESSRLFTAAFLKRYVGMGPDGLGAIYITDYSGGDPAAVNPTSSLLIDLAANGVNVGSISGNVARGLSANVNNNNRDAEAFGKVGKHGLGDIDISDSGNTLFAVNLFQRNIVTIDISNFIASGTLPGAAQVGSISIPHPSCNLGVSRPFALKVDRGKLYVGLTCTAENSGNSNDLSGTVLAYDLTTNTWNTAVNSFALNYTRGAATDNTCQTYQPWTDSPIFTYTQANAYLGATIACHPTPILSDIEFDIDGSMIINIFDRGGINGVLINLVLIILIIVCMIFASREKFYERITTMATLFSNPVEPLLPVEDVAQTARESAAVNTTVMITGSPAVMMRLRWELWPCCQAPERSF